MPLRSFLSEPHGGVGVPYLEVQGLGGWGEVECGLAACLYHPQGTEHLLSPKRASLASAQLSLCDNRHG